ncbi:MULTISPECIES: hypothetical protein [unclassified Paraburkholderia]|uniref:hypothetical protein n=1 Tax=unclassified Paraburkholderia TaxID=2615204 RepID=UPI002AB128A7|nr:MULTISPECIES: hypothetical protein [unclassified Paraburkholderia]
MNAPSDRTSAAIVRKALRQRQCRLLITLCFSCITLKKSKKRVADVLQRRAFSGIALARQHDATIVSERAKQQCESGHGGLRYRARFRIELDSLVKFAGSH